MDPNLFDINPRIESRKPTNAIKLVINSILGDLSNNKAPKTIGAIIEVTVKLTLASNAN